MRKSVIGAVLIGLWTAATPVRAGIYNPAEPGEGTRYSLFKSFDEKTLFPLRTIRADKVERDNALRLRYVLMAEMAPKSFTRDMKVGERLSIEAYLIRRGEYDKAIKVIEWSTRQAPEPENFLQTSHQAMANFLSGDPQKAQRAVDLLSEALKDWPGKLDSAKELMPILVQMGWDQDSFAFYKEAEKYLLKLFRLRLPELRTKASDQPQAHDKLFNVKFVGESGQFEAGKLAASQRAKLPGNELHIVQQLLIWMPDDARLYWLLGEIYNAQGDTAAAFKIFDDLAGFNGRLRVPALVERRNVLLSARRQENKKDDANPADLKDPVLPAQPNRVDWQALGVGFVLGMIVSFFVPWQVREWRRRWQGKQAQAAEKVP